MTTNNLQNLLKIYVEQSVAILTDNLVGIYLHGSAVMGCFNEVSSDVDLIVVVNHDISDEIKLRYMNMVVQMNECAPKKGIEMSIVRRDVCNPFLYPTPFELHFSVMHLEWFTSNPSDYIEKMKGIDKDLAAHFTIITHRGKCLYGEAIDKVFEEVGKEAYFDCIWEDIENSENEITKTPTYLTLNLCRVLAYKVDGLILSKKEGGEWGLEHLPESYHSLIIKALDDYVLGKSMEADANEAKEYARYLLEQIREESE